MRDNWNLPKGWQLAELGEIAIITDSLHKTPSYSASGLPMVRVTDIKPGSLDLSKTFKVTDEVFTEFTRNAKPQEGDIIISRVGSYGITSYVNNNVPFCLGQNTALISPRINSRYIYLALQSEFVKAQIDSAAVGSTQKTISLKSIRNLKIPIGSEEEVERIAHILGTLDDKIELNRLQNETLESLARALFQSWFVDFDPVRAKTSGETEATICQRLGLSPQVLALFPAALEDSSLGEVPAGWEVKRLPDLVEINPTRSLRKDTLAPYLDMANVPAHSARINNVVERAFGSGTKFINGDTLLARITPCLENGKTAYVDFLEENQVGWGSTEFIVLRPKAPLPTEFGYLLARHVAFRDFAIAHMEGTSGRQRVPANCFKNYFMAKPPKAIAELFSEITKPLIRQIKQQDEESRTLATLRDKLLPRLLSGEFMVTTIS